MLPKAKRDTLKVLLSPMPGKLVSLAVKVGDSVEVGQELAIVEVRTQQQRSPPRAPSWFVLDCFASVLTSLTPSSPPPSPSPLLSCERRQ